MKSRERKDTWSANLSWDSIHLLRQKDRNLTIIHQLLSSASFDIIINFQSQKFASPTPHLNTSTCLIRVCSKSSEEKIALPVFKQVRNKVGVVVQWIARLSNEKSCLRFMSQLDPFSQEPVCLACQPLAFRDKQFGASRSSQRIPHFKSF